MNRQECDVLNALLTFPGESQRSLAAKCGHSLGVVNRSLQALRREGFVGSDGKPTAKADSFAAEHAPKRAVILAAGFGMRMVPINLDGPKALLEVGGRPIIERLIEQLHAVGVREIYVVVGFMKERFEYLIDDYGVQLIVNREYASKNNLWSLSLAGEHLSDCYIVPCDVWCATNPFSERELYSWYMVGDQPEEESDVRINRFAEVIRVPGSKNGNQMLSICYLTEQDGAAVRENLKELCAQERYDTAFWEEALYPRTEGADRMLIGGKQVSCRDVVEIDTYEQLRELDKHSNQLKSGAIAAICKVLQATEEEITEIGVLKKGMTNRSFCFVCKGKKYIMRIPGEGTDKLIDRKQEAEVFRTLSGLGICDDPVYIDPESGYKISAFLEDIRCCDPDDVTDLTKCMHRLRSFHEMGLRVDHVFELFGQIDFYESLWEGKPSVYRDYQTTKAHVLALKPYIDAHACPYVLTHIDAVPDNFLFYDRGNGEELQLTDWEYAGMQDPHVDIAMFCVYAMYDRSQVERLIDLYFENACPMPTRIKIYCYIAACGLLWSNWCEYKSILGVEFGEYSLRQYRFAKEYYRIAAEAMKQQGESIE